MVQLKNLPLLTFAYFRAEVGCQPLSSRSLTSELRSISRNVFIGYKYYSLLVSCFHGVHFTETIQLCERVEPFWQ